MNTIKMAITLLLLSWHTCWAATPLGDIDVKLEVTAQPRIEIEKTAWWLVRQYQAAQ